MQKHLYPVFLYIHLSSDACKARKAKVAPPPTYYAGPAGPRKLKARTASAKICKLSRFLLNIALVFTSIIGVIEQSRCQVAKAIYHEGYVA